MPYRFPSLRSAAPIVLLGAPLIVLLCVLCPLPASAQDDAPSLGDLARNLRKDKLQQSPQQQSDPARPVIDNDNLAQVTDDAKKARPVKPDKTVFSIDPSSNTLKVSSPDDTLRVLLEGSMEKTVLSGLTGRAFLASSVTWARLSLSITGRAGSDCCCGDCCNLSLRRLRARSPSEGASSCAEAGNGQSTQS